LTDFGIAKTVGNETKLTSTGMTVGSVGYMSPEQALGNEVDNRSDLYSLGVLFWQMLTGALPYSAQDPFALALKHASSPIPELPGPLVRFQPVIERLMAKKPENRFTSADDLVRFIDSIPYDDIGARSPANCDETVVLSRVPDRTPTRRSDVTKAVSVPEPAPKRRVGLALVGIAVAAVVGVAAYMGKGGLLTPTGQAPAASPQAPTASGEVDEHPSQRPVHAPSEMPTAQGVQGRDTAPAPRATAAPADEPKGRAQQDIEVLLRQAGSQWKAGRLTEPPGDNAFESYSRVLELDPEHPQAKEALVQIGRINAANKIFLSADALLRRGEIADARSLIETGLRMNPDDERLLGLQRALDFTQ
jgi:serine/threonine-protein kinase PpkA